MAQYELTEGQGRTRLTLRADDMGGDLAVSIYNENAHIGAVAVGEYDAAHARASVSVITRLGHKDDAIAQSAALQISRSLHRPVCVIAGVHLDDIAQNEIEQFLENAELAVAKLINLKMGSQKV